MNLKTKTHVQPIPICGHEWPGDLSMGHETEFRVIERNGVKYVGSVEHIFCSKCNAATDRRFMRAVRKLEREMK